MKRLKLDMDDLRVESFASTNEPAGGRGTVRAHAKATYGCTQGYDSCDTLYATCDDFTCHALTGCFICSGYATTCVSEASCLADCSAA